MVVVKFRPPIKVPKPRKTSRKARIKISTYYPNKDFKNSMKLTELPSETLNKIFSYFSIKELFYNIRPVCRRFREIAMSPVHWKEINVENEITTNTLKFWIKSAKLLKHFGARHRNDGNTIAEEVSKCCRQLESIRLQNCWGSRRNFLLHSTPLCHLVTRCPKLNTFNFSQSRFMSCKFFRLISKDEKNGSIMKRCNYTGPMSIKQMKALLATLDEFQVHEACTIGNVDLNHRLRLKDIVRYMRNDPSANQMIHEVWENINFGQDNQNENQPQRGNDFGMDVDI